MIPEIASVFRSGRFNDDINDGSLNVFLPS